jgi:UDP-N-acetylmuramoylalanine--D-glutamate ligase
LALPELTAMRIAVLGLGRSGLAIARAAQERGAHPAVYDRATRDGIVKRHALEEVERLGIPIHFEWDRPFTPAQADIVVSNPAVDSRRPVLVETVASGVPVWSEIEFAYRISNAPIVAITGTNGKSTTTVMTYLCLEGAGQKAVLCGNVFGSGYDEIPLSEAAAASIAGQVLVAEVSSFQLEWIERFRPAVAGITNISPDHLDRYDSFEAYAATKARIFENQTSEDVAVVRAHNPVVRPPAGPRVLTFGRQGEHATVTDEALEILGERAPWDEFAIESEHDRLNAAMAALLACGFLGRGGKIAAAPGVLEGLKKFRGLAHRMEHVGERGGIRLINNSMCTNPEAVVRSAQAVGGPVRLLVGGANKGLDFTPLRAFLDETGTRCYLFGSYAADLQTALGPANPIHATLSEALDAALSDARSGDTVMLAPGCASTDQFEDFRERGNVFKSLAKEWLES